MIQPRTLCELFQESHHARPRAHAYLCKVDGTYTPVSSQTVVDRVHALASGLRQIGVQPGDRIAILGTNSLEWAVADYAILHCGAVTVPIYPTLQADAVQHILHDCEAMAVFVATTDQLSLLGPTKGLPHLQHAIVFEDGAEEGRDGARTIHGIAEFETRGAALQDTEEFERVWRAVRPHDVATIIYTSGTTGIPKGAMLTHDNLVSNVLAVLRRLPLGPTDTCLSFLPLSHVMERMAGHFVMWHAGTTIAFAESVDKVPQNLVEVRPTVLVSVPRLYEKMNARVLAALEHAPPLRQKLFAWAQGVGRQRVRLEQSGKQPGPWLQLQAALASKLVFSKLRARLGGRMRFMISGGAPLATDIAEFFFAADLPILEGYGLTETSPVICVNPLGRPRIGTVGPPIDGAEVRIAENGEILAKGRNIMQGYYGQPEATAKAIEDGWFHTGDVGAMTPEGYLRITDRLKDLIVTSGGKNIAPQPIESRLKSCAYIAEAILVGDRRNYLTALIVPHFAHLEERAKALGIDAAARAQIVAAPEILRLFTDVFNAVNSQLPSYERIKRFCLLERELQIEAGEITPSMKVKRNVVAKRYARQIDAMYADPPPAYVGCPETHVEPAAAHAALTSTGSGPS